MRKHYHNKIRRDETERISKLYKKKGVIKYTFEYILCSRKSMFTKKKNLKNRLTTAILAGLMSTSSIIPSITNVHAEEETASHQTVFSFKEKNEGSDENAEFAKYFADGNIGFKFEYSIGNQFKTISKTYISDNAELNQTVGNKTYEFTTPEVQIEENEDGNTFAYRASIVPAQEKYNDYFLKYGENSARTVTGNKARNTISYEIIKVNRNIRLYSLENSGETFRLEDVTNYDKEQIRAAIYEANPELKVWNDNLKASDPSFELLQFDKKGVHTTFPIRANWNIPQIRFGYFGDEDHNDRGLLRPIKPAPSFAKITYRWKDHRDFTDEFTSYKVVDGVNKIERTLAMNTAKSFITYNDANGITAGTEEIVKPIGSKITNDDLHAPEGTHLTEEVNHTVSENEDDNKFVALIEYNTVEIGVIYKKGEDVVKTEVITKKVKDVVTNEDLPALPNSMHFIDEFTGYTVTGKNDQITRLVDDDTATQVVVHVTYKDSDGKVVKEEDIAKKIGEKVTDNDLTAPEGTHFTGDPTDYTVTEENNKIERLVDYNEVTVKVVYKDKNGRKIKVEELKKKIGSNIKESELPSTPDGVHFTDKFDGYVVTGKDDKIERVVEENESNDAIIKVVYKDKDGNIVKQEDLKRKIGDKITNQDLTAPDGMHVVGTVEYDITKKEESLDVHVEMNKTSGHISFIANIADGPRYNEFDVTFGEVLPKFSGIKVNGYDFIGFFKDAAMTDPVTFEEVVNDDMTIYVKYEANHELDFAKKYNTANKPASNKPADTGAAMYGFTFLCLSALFAIVGYIVLLYKKEKMD